MDRLWPKHHAAGLGLLFLSAIRTPCWLPAGKHQLRKEPFALCWWQSLKEMMTPERQASALTMEARGPRGLGWRWQALAREVNKITSVFNPVPPLTLLRPTWSSKHKDLENEKDFSSDKGRKEEIKSCKQGEQRSYDSILCISQWSFTSGHQNNTSLVPDAPNLRSLSCPATKGGNHALAKAFVTVWLNTFAQKTDKLTHSKAFRIQTIRARRDHKDGFFFFMYHLINEKTPAQRG